MELPAGLTSAPYTFADLDAVFAVAAAQQQHDIGRVDVERADFEADWQRPSFDFARMTMGVYDGDELVAFAELIGAGRGEAGVLPAYRRRGIGTALARWLEDGRPRARLHHDRRTRPAGLRRRPAAGEARVPRPLDQLGAPGARGRDHPAPRRAARATRSGPRPPTTTRPSGPSSRTPSSSGRSATGSRSTTSSPSPSAAPATSPGCCGWSPTRPARSSAPRCW